MTHDCFWQVLLYIAIARIHLANSHLLIKYMYSDNEKKKSLKLAKGYSYLLFFISDSKCFSIRLVDVALPSACPASL